MDLAEALQAKGVQVTLASRADNRQIMEERAAARGMPIFSVDHWNLWMQETGLDLVQFDLVHLHHCSNYVLGTQARDFNYVFGSLPMVATLHGPEPLEDFLTLRRGMSAKIGARFFRALIVPSRHKYEAWTGRGFFKGKLHQIPNPIRELVLGDQAEAKRSLGFSEDEKVLLFLGRIRPEKDPDAILRAWKHLGVSSSKTGLLVVGRGDEGILMGMKDDAQRLGIHAAFPGFLSEPASAYAAADAFLFTSLYDNFPIALFEAAAAGVPIVAAEIPVVRHEFSGRPGVSTYDASDPKSLAAAVENALTEEAEARAELKRSTLERFGFDAVARMHIDLYERVLQGSLAA